jgi:Kef-type K+ transport system membrane component KefB
MITQILVERFFLVGVVAWVVAVLIGVGAFFDLWSWRRQWPVAGALAGAGTFAFYVATYSITSSLIGLVGGLFVGCGIALTYGTLFLKSDVYRPVLREGSPEEHLWLRDAVDRLRPEPMDWMVTAGLLAPGAGLAWVGVSHLFATPPVVIGLASLSGPIFAAAGLAIRHRVSSRMLRELATRAVGDGSETGRV